MSRAHPRARVHPAFAVGATVAMLKEGRVDAPIAIRTAIATLAVRVTIAFHTPVWRPRNQTVSRAHPRARVHLVFAAGATVATATARVPAAPAAAATATAMHAAPDIR